MPWLPRAWSRTTARGTAAVARKRPTGMERLKELLAALKTKPHGDLRPTLAGYAYRFTLYLPLLSEGKAVFTSAQRDLLADLFHIRFEGYSATAIEGGPPWYGSWLPPGAERPIIDRHMVFIVYTPPGRRGQNIL